MGKSKGKKTKRVNFNLNFRETHSERSANRSYKTFGKFIRGKRNEK